MIFSILTIAALSVAEQTRPWPVWSESSLDLWLDDAPAEPYIADEGRREESYWLRSWEGMEP